MFKCEICGKLYKTMNDLAVHLVKRHHKKLEDYYDEYIDSSDKKCPYCSKKRAFCSLSRGYKKTCSDKSCRYRSMSKTYRKTCNEKYGCDAYTQAKNFKEQAAETKLKKYGDRNFNNKAKREKTCLKLFGNYTNLGTAEWKNKSEATMMQRYGVRHNWQLASEHIIAENTAKEIRVKRWNDLFTENKSLLRLSSHVFRCLKCDNVFCYYGSHFPSCHICHPVKSIYSSQRSEFENEMIEEIQKFYKGKIIENDREILDGKELDIYFPDVKLAIECDGIYWHSGNLKPSTYHLEKTEKCESKGIHLLHIYDSEWYEQQDVIIDRIKSLLGFNKKLGARQCHCEKIENDDYELFCESYHIQGSVKAKWKYGLYFKDELVAVASFGKSRFKKDEYELLRYCSKAGLSVLGGMKKLVSHFKKETGIVDVVSYADRRYTMKEHSVYGNDIISISKPGYSYVTKNGIENRMNFQKYKLKNNPLTKDFYKDELTESEICELAGLRKLYDCGQIKFRI